eukprot:Em0002g1319a
MESIQAFRIKLERANDKVLPLGAGAYGKVYGISYNGAPCIAKSLHDILMGRGLYEAVPSEQTKSLFTKFVQECHLHSKLRHPNIVQFIGVEYGNDPQNNNDLRLVMERMDTDLKSWFELIPNIPLAIKLSVLRDVSAGLLYLHSFNPHIIHGDLTTTNILLTQDWRAKIADFGNSVDENILSTAPGALIYMPPEAFVKPLTYDTKLDIFSFGVVSVFTVIQAVPQGCGKREELIQRLGADQQLKSIYQIVTWCCEKDQRKRPSSMDLNTHLQELCLHDSHVMNMKLMMKLYSSSVAPEVSNNVPDRNLVDAQKELKEMKPRREKELSMQIEALKKTVDAQKVQIQAYTEDFLQERADRTIAAAERFKIAEQLEQCKAEWEESKANMQLFITNMQQIIDDLTKADQLKHERLQSSEEAIRHLKAKLEEISRTNSAKVANKKSTSDKTEQLQAEAFQNELKQCTQKLIVVKKHLTDTEYCMQVQAKALNSELKAKMLELEASNEEIAVKVAQVKQYQKQVEAYKQAQPKNESEQLYNEETRMTAQLVEEINQLKKTLAHGTQASSSRSVGERPLHEHPGSWASTATTDPDDDLPPPIMLPKAYYPVSHLPHNGRPLAYPAQASQHQHEDPDGMTAPVDIPFDPNLVCPICRRMFRKGESQLCRQHAQLCSPSSCND